MSDSTVKSLDDWKEEAISCQINICKHLGDRFWDEFSYPNEREELFKKVAVALYGSPLEIKNDFGLPSEKVEFVNTLIEKFYNYSIHKDKIIIGIIFVSVFIEEAIVTWVPVFRVLHRVKENQMTKEDVQNNIFIDHMGRVYNDYSSYLAENTWERSWLCLPKYGYYENKVSECSDLNNTSDSEIMLDDGYYDCYKKTVLCINEFLFHSQESRGYVTKKLDYFANFANIGSTVGVVTGFALSFIPPIAPFAATAATCSAIAGTPGTIYGVGRSIEKIVDRYQHDQSLSLADSEARQCWLITATSAASIGALSASGILTNMAKNGAVISTATRGICTGINATATALSGVSLANNGYELCRKEEITGLDILQFSTSLLFFTHSLVNFKTARAIIEEVQQSEISAIKNNISHEHHKKFDNLLKNVKKSAAKKAAVDTDITIQGQAEFIRKLKRIDDPNEYFQSIRITKKGNICLNNKLSINPKSYLKLSENEEKILLSSTKDLQDQRITMSDFNKKVKPLIKKHRMGVVGSQQEGIKSETAANNSKSPGISLNTNNSNQKTTSSRKKIFKSNLKQSKESSMTYNKKIENNELVIDIINSFFRDCKREILNLSSPSINDIIEFLLEKLNDEIRRRIEENSNPERPDSMQVEQYYASQVSSEKKFKNLCESACKLATTCRDCDFEIPVRCLELILENVEGKIFNVTWTKNDSIITCYFLSESSDEISFDFHIGSKHIVTNIFKNGISFHKPIVHPLPEKFVSVTTSNEEKIVNYCDSLSDLAASCSLINTNIPEECFEFIMKISEGKIYDINWSSNNNCIKCTFSIQQNRKMTIELFLGDNYFLSRVYENGIIYDELKINHLQLDDD